MCREVKGVAIINRRGRFGYLRTWGCESGDDRVLI